jgi:hypothetical protein
MSKCLRSFVIGSSFPVFVLWFLKYQQISKKTWTYESATIINPLYFGTMNLLAYYLGKKYNWSLRKRLIIISFLSSLIICTLTTSYNFYGFNKLSQYLWYYLKVSFFHFFTYNVIIYYLENNIQ